MPQKRKNFVFQCSDCAYPDSSSDEESKTDNVRILKKIKKIQTKILSIVLCQVFIMEILYIYKFFSAELTKSLESCLIKSIFDSFS